MTPQAQAKQDLERIHFDVDIPTHSLRLKIAAIWVERFGCGALEDCPDPMVVPVQTVLRHTGVPVRRFCPKGVFSGYGSGHEMASESLGNG